MLRSSKIPVNARRTRIAVLYRDRFLHTVYFDGVDVTLADATEIIGVSRQLLGADALPSMIDVCPVRSITSEARAFYASPAVTRIAPAFAMIVSSPLSRTLVNFYLGFNRPPVPTRMFTDNASAEKWLEGYAPRLERVA